METCGHLAARVLRDAQLKYPCRLAVAQYVRRRLPPFWNNTVRSSVLMGRSICAVPTSLPALSSSRNTASKTSEYARQCATTPCFIQHPLSRCTFFLPLVQFTFHCSTMSATPRRAQHLLQTPVFKTSTHGLTRSEKTRISQERARAIMSAYGSYITYIPTLNPAKNVSRSPDHRRCAYPVSKVLGAAPGPVDGHGRWCNVARHDPSQPGGWNYRSASRTSAGAAPCRRRSLELSQVVGTLV